ncbi:MAG: HEAT repeat domain-containing protein [Desulfamplus sp.]|nr:HEAT repeat domain-containing protein [Desulfamplus sp.]
MEKEINQRESRGRFASALNAVGSSTVWVYDATANGLNKVWSAVKKVPDFQPVPKGMFTKGLGFIKTGEIGKLEKKVAEYEKEIKALYFEIGKEGARSADGNTILESDNLKQLLADVKEYEKEIERLKNRISELKEEKIAAKIRQKELKKEAAFAKLKEKVSKEKASIEQINKVVENSINTALKTGVFESRSEEEIFYKVAHDLLDSEMEIKYLAAAEIGKIGNDAGVPILMDAVRYDDPDLTAEIINSLISIGDSRAVPLFIKELKSEKYRVRIGCLRGLFKLAGEDVSMPALIEALRDDHPEVRRTALTFIGWKDPEDAVPAVSQCLIDEEARVRKAAVSALANLKDESSVLSLIKVLGDKELEIREKALEAIRAITGENIEFDVNAAGAELSEAVLKLKQWWQDERMTKVKGDAEGESAITGIDSDDLVGDGDVDDERASEYDYSLKDELSSKIKEALSDEDEEAIDQEEAITKGEVLEQTSVEESVEAAFDELEEEAIKEDAIKEDEDSDAKVDLKSEPELAPIDEIIEEDGYEDESEEAKAESDNEDYLPDVENLIDDDDNGSYTEKEEEADDIELSSELSLEADEDSEEEEDVSYQAQKEEDLSIDEKENAELGV